MSLLIVFIPVFLLNRHAVRFFDLFTRTDLEDHLRHYAFIVGEQFRGVMTEPADGPPRVAFDRWLRSTAGEINSRIQIVDLSGVVLHDTAEPPEIGASLIDRAEVAEAVKGGYSARSRLTPDRTLMYFHIARPIKDADRKTVAVTCITRHTQTITQAVKQMIRNQRIATWLAISLAVAAATVVSLSLTRRLRALTRAAQRFALGRGPLDTPLRGRDEIAELDRALHAMAEELAARHQYNREFISTTLHELRTPLTAIKGAAEILRDGAAEPDARRRFMNNILHQTDRMMRLVGELRELTRLDAEDRAAPGEPVEYFAFLKTTLAHLEDTFPSPRAKLRFDIPEGGNVHVAIIPHRIEQVLSNLLDNAFRFTPPDGAVTVHASIAAGKVLTCIEDTGCGIRPEDLPRVFDRFFTTERHSTPRDYGSGLGLTIAQSIIRNHHGRIWVESEPGCGARFWFELPAT
jgi:signal transduction histidine kinase